MSNTIVGFNINLTLTLNQEEGKEVWLDPQDKDEIKLWLTRYLKNIEIYSVEIGDTIAGYGASVDVNEVRFWKNE